MRLVNTTDYCEKIFGMEKTIELMACAGFDGLDFAAYGLNRDDYTLNNSDYLKTVELWKKKSEEFNIPFVQAHAPTPSSDNDEEFNKIMRCRIIKCLEISSLLGIEKVVVHPMQHLTYNTNIEKLFELNMDFYRSLIPYCEKFNVKIAIENMYQFDKNRNVCVDSVCAAPQEFVKYVDTLDSKWITACLDIGHVGLCGREAFDVIKYMGANRITALHVHDNDYKGDSHSLPCLYKINWDKVCAALKEIGYKGDFTYEARNFLTNYDVEFIPTALKFMHDTGRYLISKIEK